MTRIEYLTLKELNIMKLSTWIVFLIWYLTINQINILAQSLESLDLNSLLIEKPNYMSLAYENDFKNSTRIIYFEKGLSISRKYTFLGGIVLSNSEPDLIGANYERPDIPVFSTGRVYASEINYHSGAFNLRVGRLRPKYYLIRQSSQWNSARISGDGVNWSYKHKAWIFSNSIEFLPAERISSGETFDRILNFHQLSFKAYRDFSISLGEFSIYTGINQGINLLRSNPFIPYTVHNYDTDSSTKSGFSGDLDNHILYGEIAIIKKSWEFKFKSYVDEFQIDSEDRKVLADHFLFIGEFWTELTEPQKSNYHPEAVLRYSRSNIAFGTHSGVLTSFTVGSVPLLPHELGQKERLDILFSLSSTSNLFLILNYYHLKYVDLNDIDLNNLNLKNIQRELNIGSKNGVDLRFGGVFKETYNIKFLTMFENDRIETISIILQISFF